MRAMTLIAGLIGSSVGCAQDVFVDEDACPGEGCGYGETWIARESIPLREMPESSASVALIVQAGESVRTMMGEVHTIPARFEVRRSEGEFVPGDEVLVYTYLGEGWFRIRHNGSVKEADLGFSPWGGTGGSRCTDAERCWGSLTKELQFDWWVLVETEAGVEGWTRLEGGVMGEQWASGQ